MCVTVGPATLEETIIGTWDIEHPTLGLRRVLAYQNVPYNHNDEPNCMILPIPSIEPLNREHLLDTSKEVHFLKKMADQIVPKDRSFSGSVKRNYVWEMGIYHVAMLNEVNTESLEEALSLIPVEKRPLISLEFLDFYSSHYKGNVLLLCCFNNKDAKQASPIMIHYTPMDWEYFFCPTLESHGGVPDFGENITFHQKIIFGTSENQAKRSNFMPLSTEVSNDIIKSFLPDYAIGAHLQMDAQNADVLISKSKSLQKQEIMGEWFGGGNN